MKTLIVRYRKYALIVIAAAAVAALLTWSPWLRSVFTILAAMLFWAAVVLLWASCGVIGTMLIVPKFFKREPTLKNLGILIGCEVLGPGVLVIVLIRGVPTYEDSIQARIP